MIKNITYLSRFMIIFVFILLTISTTVEANESQLPQAPIFIDGEPFTTKYMMRDGHLLVPAIFLKNTGAYVDWNEQYSSVVFRVKDTMFALPVGKEHSDDFIKDTNTWERMALPIKTIEFNNEVFIPLVDVARKLGMGVRYDVKLARTFITSNINIKPNTIIKGERTEKLVALTFDDGPESFYTPQILDILKEKGVPATFFVMGKQIEAFPEEMKRIVNENHGIGNHTWNHPNLRRVWTATVREEILATQKEMERVVGRKPDIFRPPFGSISKSDIAVLNELGMRNIMWSVDTLDWSGLTGDEILEIVHRDITPGGIILQHNFQSNARLLDGTVEALPKIIDELRAKGYKFVTVQTLLAN
ncbi:polysaccharide deacetylase family protein [Anaerobacillus isosaccharinicus]|uniref:Polysaccharide deacetylase family protein n=1 Tax=Anaerobacillus isosaccharinicus TaxID=1532552 RepID=A0A7S7LB66_9BACI|nr:polysaccharide deacetylase family protein [Anaerobacillus isosaccharinicus]MBA5588780.1 polysaccharide deacetylase family protein [Anaerobacillus isosaccharinicus]QOY37824.1 polysaccharide deacetylase family protein [Anaerobacillus isosaccharinicus]